MRFIGTNALEKDVLLPSWHRKRTGLKSTTYLGQDDWTDTLASDVHITCDVIERPPNVLQLAYQKVENP